MLPIQRHFFKTNKKVAQRGGRAAGKARQAIEQETKTKIVSPKKAKGFSKEKMKELRKKKS